jgi:hypothetical protein
MAERKAVIKNADMSEDMQQDAVDCASQALEKYNIEKVIFFFFFFYLYYFCSFSFIIFFVFIVGYCCVYQKRV